MRPSTCADHALLFSFTLFTTLHVTAQIAWLTKPRNTAVTLGQDLVVDCRAVSEGPSGGQLTYTWLFNQSAVQPKALLMANTSLFVPRVGREEEGEYTCVVREAQGAGQATEVQATAQVVIAYIRDFIMQPENMSAPIGSEAVLTCVTGRSAPYPTVHWEMNDARLENAKALTASYGEFDRTGLSAQISMKLMYRVVDDIPRSFRCVAQNPLSGETVKSSAATVTPTAVDVLPQILSVFTPQVIAREFQQLTLDCDAIGYPPPYVLWFKDAHYVDDSRVFIRPNRTLVIPRVTLEDAGLYSCKARNRVGNVRSNATLVIVASIGLEFAKEPSDVTVLAGNAVTLHCTPPHSVPPASVTWYKDYAPVVQRTGVFAATVIANGAERNLHFSSVQESDEGAYYCVASNSYSVPTSRTSTIAQLTVRGAPVITEPPIDTKVVKGTLLHLTCHVDLATVRSVFWTFNGERLQTSSTVSVTNWGQELWVNDVGKSWEGRYTCTAENNYGQKVVSAFVTIIVPPVTLQMLGSRSVTVNYAVLLPCFIYGDPLPAFVWYHDGQLVTEDERHRLLATGLYIDPVRVEDKGDYSCRGNNSGGLAWSNGTLVVIVPPTADVGDAEITAVVGQPLTLRCNVQGHPSPLVHWLHNGTSGLGRQVELSYDNTSLTILAFTWSSSGQYTCVAVNSEDTALATVVVRAQVKPLVVDIVGKTSVDIRRSLNLTCRVQGVPAPQISWRHNGTHIEADLDGRVSFPHPGALLVKFVTKSDEGQYECVATSILGNSSRRVSIIIVEPPRPPQLLEARALSVNSVLLRWQHVFQAPSTDVDAFIVHYRKRVGGSQVEYPHKLSALTLEKEVDGLDAGTEYVFSVSAENSAGQGVPSNTLTATTFQTGPSEPENLRVVTTTATTATVAWETPSHTNGNIERYQLQFRKQGEADYSVMDVTSSSSPTQTVMLEMLDPNTRYNIRVRAANLWQGQTLWGLFSPDLALLTTMTVPSEAPSDIRASALDPYSVLVTWQPVPIQQQHGPITRYRITYRLDNAASALGTLTANSSEQSLTIRGLSPWTRYSLTLEAENPKGLSPRSDVVSVRTDPAVPGAPPQGVAVSALPGNALLVTWQPVPARSRNSELAVYVVQYRQGADPAWAELSTLDNETLSLSVSDVLPWSWYEVRVAAETRQVSPGRGPFSAPVQIHTLQAPAGPVQSVSFNTSTTAISLAWAPPLLSNGVLTGYRVDYHPVPPTGREKSIRVVVNGTHAELRRLQPGVLYNISITALNAAGRGNATILRVSTASLPAELQSPNGMKSTLMVTTMDEMYVTTATNQTSTTSHQLPVIIAGSLTGACILLIILAYLLYHCFRAQRETRAKYLVCGGLLQGYRSGFLYSVSFCRNMDDTDSVVITTSQRSLSQSSLPPSSSPPSSSPPEQQQQQQQDKAPQQLTDTSWLAKQAQRVEDAAEGPPVYLPVEGAAATNVHTSVILPPSDRGEVFTVQELESSFEDSQDNLGFSEDKMLLPGLSSASAVSLPEEEGAEQQTLTRRKGRMHSQSAAAIAVLRSATSATIAADDTQFLLSKSFSNIDTEVVFNHRTVL